jgi:hypothetical protein
MNADKNTANRQKIRFVGPMTTPGVMSCKYWRAKRGRVTIQDVDGSTPSLTHRGAQVVMAVVIE